MFCINCGAKIADSAKFCPSCGYQIPTNSIQAEGNAQSSCLNSGEHTKLNNAEITNINNNYYRLLQISPIIFIVAAIIIPFAYLLLLKLIAVIYVIVCCKCDIKEIKQKTSKDVSFSSLSIVAIIIFDVLYAERYLCNRKKVIPNTSRILFYLSLFVGISIFFCAPKNNPLENFSVEPNNNKNDSESSSFMDDKDRPFSNIDDSRIKCSSSEVIDSVTELLFKVKKLPLGMKLTFDGVSTVSNEGSIKICEASINFNIPSDTRKRIADDFNHNIFWDRVENEVKKDIKKMNSLQQYYVDNALISFAISYDAAIKKMALEGQDLIEQRVQYTITEYDDRSGFNLSLDTNQVSEAWATIIGIIKLWGLNSSDANQSITPSTSKKDNSGVPTVTKEEIYAVYNQGEYRNYEEGVFACSYDYCKNINEQQLTQEERNFVKPSNIRGSVKIEFNKTQNSYQATGGFYVENACMLSAGGDSLSTPVLCSGGNNSSITCDFYDVFNDQTLSFVFKIEDNQLKVSLSPNSDISDEINTNKCMSLIQNTPIKFESSEDHNRILRLSTKLEFIKANADISALWKSLSDETRKRVLSEQRKWIKHKDATCGKSDMKGSVEEISTMQKCHTTMTEHRIRQLESLLEDK